MASIQDHKPLFAGLHPSRDCGVSHLLYNVRIHTTSLSKIDIPHTAVGSRHSAQVAKQKRLETGWLELQFLSRCWKLAGVKIGR